jgi:hypothetical protein
VNSPGVDYAFFASPPVIGTASKAGVGDRVSLTGAAVAAINGGFPVLDREAHQLFEGIAEGFGASYPSTYLVITYSYLPFGALRCTCITRSSSDSP